MAVQWGPARESSTNGARVGIELAVSGSGSTRTVVFEIWLWTKRASYGSSASYSYSGTFQGSGSGTFSYNHTNNSTDWSTSNRTRIARWSKTWTLQYGQTINITAGASVSGLGGNIPQPVSHSRSVTLPARSYNPPATPGSPSVTRSSDSAQVIKWTNRGTTSAPVTRTRIRRRNYDGNPRGSYTSYTDRGTSTGTSFTDSTVGNWWYEYAIRAEGPGGNSAWVYLPGINTTPGSPKNVRVTPSSDGNLIQWDPGHRWITGITMEVQRQEGSGSWTNLAFGLHAEDTATLHPDPNPAVTHRYRVRARASNPVLYSDWAYSDVVQLASPPSAPTNHGPSTPWDATEARTWTWRHVPTDGSTQQRFQVRHRLAGTTTWTTETAVQSSAEQWTLPAGSYSNGDTIERQVRTWGVHPDPGPWSTTQRDTPQARPTVSINSPEHGTELDNSATTLSWGYAQEAGFEQAAWRYELRDGDGRVVRTRSGNGTASTHTLTNLADGATYTVAVEVRSTHGLWSDPDEVTFTVSYLPPAPPSMEAAWDVERGAAALQLEQPTWTEDTAEPSHHQVWRAADRHSSRAWFALQDALRSREEHGLVEPRRNLVTNPRGRRTNGTWKVRENLSLDPRPRSAWSGTTDPDMPFMGKPSQRATGTTLIVGENVVARRASVEAGKTYTITVWMRSPEAFTGQVRYYLYSSGTTFSDFGPPVDVPANEWTPVSATFTVEEGQTSTLPMAYGAPSGQTWWVGAVLIEEGGASLPYFDGDTWEGDPDFTPEWTGTPGESTSQLVAPRPVGLGAVNGVVYYSQSQDALAVMRLRPNSPTNSTYVINNTEMPEVNGQTYTLVTEIWSSMPTVEMRGYKIGTMNTSLRQSFPGAGTYRNSGVREGTGAFVPINLYAPPTSEGDVVYFRHAYIEGEYDGPYFDGDMEDTDDIAYEWEGEPDNSISVMKDTAVSRAQSDFDAAWQAGAVLIDDHVELGTATTDPIPIIGDGTVNLYRPVTVSVLPSIAEGEIIALEVPHRDTHGWVYLNTGPDMSQVCRVRANASRSGTRGIEREQERYFGRQKPVEYTGEVTTNRWDVSARVWPNPDGASSEEELVELQQADGVVCYRDPWGKRWFASMSPVQDSFSGYVGEVSWSMTEVDYREGLAELEDGDG